MPNRTRICKLVSIPLRRLFKILKRDFMLRTTNMYNLLLSQNVSGKREKMATQHPKDPKVKKAMKELRDGPRTEGPLPM